MAEVIIPDYKMDMGELGHRLVRLEAVTIKSFTGAHLIEIEAVLVNAHGVMVDVREFVQPRALDAMIERVRNQFWTDAMHRREAVGERA